MTQMNYEVIKDEQKFLNFIDWLPELKVNEKYYLSLFARKKYHDSIKGTDKAQLKRFTTTKELLVQKVKQLECPIGSYMVKEIPAPNEALALYIGVNPRSTTKAAFQTIIALTEAIQTGHQKLNPHSIAMSQLHKAPARKLFVVFDVDRKDDLQETIETTRNIVGDDAPKFLETRGGVHVIIRVAKVVSEHKNWFPELQRLLEPDQTGDLLIPVAGCCQGGFTPRFR